MPPIPRDTLTNFFNTLCDAAAKETLPRFRTRTSIDNKLDTGFDPVTEADRDAETAIREHIKASFPDHGIIGEEFGHSNLEAEFQWIIDPIDGTRAYISGLPVWGTLIGLYQSGRPIAGAMDQPFTKERYLAVDGITTLSIDGKQAQRLKTSDVAALNDATLMTTSPELLREPADIAYFQVENQVKLSRYGCDCYAYAMLAGGHVELVIESGLNSYDIAALIPIIENAGGLVSNWSGGDASQGGQILAAANAKLHEQAVELLRA